MNLAVNNFSTGGGSFDFDIIMLGGGAVILLLLGLIGFGSAASARIVTIIVGLAMGGYAFYLNFMFTGSTYRMPILRVHPPNHPDRDDRPVRRRAAQGGRQRRGPRRPSRARPPGRT